MHTGRLVNGIKLVRRTFKDKKIMKGVTVVHYMYMQVFKKMNYVQKWVVTRTDAIIIVGFWESAFKFHAGYLNAVHITNLHVS